MDDASHVWGGLALQKDSEFLELFNYYMLKGIETGIIKKLFRSWNLDWYVNEQFGMIEPQPLTYKNVMFTFICLASGMVVALVIAILEHLAKTCVKND